MMSVNRAIILIVVIGAATAAGLIMVREHKTNKGRLAWMLQSQYLTEGVVFMCVPDKTMMARSGNALTIYKDSSRMYPLFMYTDGKKKRVSYDAYPPPSNGNHKPVSVGVCNVIETAK